MITHARQMVVAISRHKTLSPKRWAQRSTDLMARQKYFRLASVTSLHIKTDRIQNQNETHVTDAKNKTSDVVLAKIWKTNERYKPIPQTTMISSS